MKFHNLFILKSYTVFIAKHTAEIFKPQINGGTIHTQCYTGTMHGHMHTTANHRTENQERGSTSDLWQLTHQKKTTQGN